VLQCVQCALQCVLQCVLCVAVCVAMCGAVRCSATSTSPSLLLVALQLLRCVAACVAVCIAVCIAVCCSLWYSVLQRHVTLVFFADGVAAAEVCCNTLRCNVCSAKRRAPMLFNILSRVQFLRRNCPSTMRHTVFFKCKKLY